MTNNKDGKEEQSLYLQNKRFINLFVFYFIVCPIYFESRSYCEKWRKEACTRMYILVHKRFGKEKMSHEMNI